jgi:hypothetical protein
MEAASACTHPGRLIEWDTPEISLPGDLCHRVSRENDRFHRVKNDIDGINLTREDIVGKHPLTGLTFPTLCEIN